MRRTITLLQQVTIADHLRARTKIVDGAVEFEANWTEARIAELVGVAPDQVASVRRRLLGNLRRRKEPTMAELEERISALERRIASTGAVDTFYGPTCGLGGGGGAGRAQGVGTAGGFQMAPSDLRSLGAGDAAAPAAPEEDKT